MRSKSKTVKLNDRPQLEPRMETSGRTRLVDAVVGTLHTYVVLLLAILCVLCMTEDVFPEIMLSTQSHSYILSEQTFGRVLGILLVFSILTGAAAEYWRRMRLLWRYLVPMAFLGMLIYYGYHHREELLEGIQYLSRPVLEAVNAYYKTNFVVYAGGWSYADRTLGFVLLCASAFFLTEAMWCRRRILLAGLPVLVLAGEMAVGKTPQMRSMVLLFLVAFLSQMGGWEDGGHPVESVVRLSAGQRVCSLLTPAVVLAASLLIGGIALVGPAEKVAEYGVVVRQMQWDMEEKAESWYQALLANAERKDWDDVTNRAPNYSDSEVLHVTFSALPTTNQYLRGYYGTYYENGKWTSDEETFDSLWQSEFPNQGIASYASYQRGMYDDVFITLSLEYVNFDTTTVYVPFTVDRSSLADGILLTGEYRVTKPAETDTVSYEFRDVDSLTWYEGLMTTNAFAEGAAASWYTSYVEDTYLEVPDSLAGAVSQTVDEIMDYSQGLMEEDEDWYLSSYFSAETYYGQILADPDSEWGNDVKYYAATLVAEYMSDWTYSLELSGVPNGTDVVAYFLTESHMGYCVHYATAATMILREMGIPARYVAGYLCSMEDAALNENGEYEVSILDSDAHAWVEIYLEGIGWYPVEVTPSAGQASSDSAALPTDTDSETNGDESETGDLDTEGIEDTEDAEDTEGRAQGDSDNNMAQGESGDADSDGAGQNSGGTGLSGDGSSGSDDALATMIPIIRTVAIVAGVLLLAAAVVTLIVVLCVILPRRREQMRLARIRRDIREGKNRKAVYGIHRMIYRKLRKKTSAATKQMTDRDYARLLEKYFPQDEPSAWEKYVGIVQKCAFSKEEVTETEASCCEELLTAVYGQEK